MSLFSYHPVSVSHVSVFLSSCIYVSCHCILTTLYLSLMSFYSYHSVSMFQVSVFLSPCNCLMSVYSYHPVSMSHVSAFLSPCIYVSCQCILITLYLCPMTVDSYHPVSVSHVGVFVSPCIYVSCQCILITLYLSHVNAFLSFCIYVSCQCILITQYLCLSVYSYHPVSMSHARVFSFAIFTVIWPILGQTRVVILSPGSRSVLQKLTFPQPVKILPALYPIR